MKSNKLAVSLLSLILVFPLTSNAADKIKKTFRVTARGLSESVNLKGEINRKYPNDKFSLSIRKNSGDFVKLGELSGSNTIFNFQISGKLSSYSKNKEVRVRVTGSNKVKEISFKTISLANRTVVVVPPTPPKPVPPTPVPPKPVPPTPVPPTPVPGPLGNFKAGATWYWQLSGTVNMSINTQIYDIDLYDNSAASFATLKLAGKKVVCYFSAGTYEDWRSDASLFPAASLGSNVEGWPGERWINVMNAGVRSIMSARLDLAKAKGCDAVEPDNVDGYSNSNGLGLTKAQQIDFNKFLAAEAHKRGLSIALKNSTDLVSSLVGDFDFAVVEECYQYDECDAYKSFASQNKAVLIAEYSKMNSLACADAKANKFSLVYFNLDLNGKKFEPCP